jgi:hypothetical protein
MHRCRWWWGLIVAVAVLSLAGCIRIRPETPEGGHVDPTPAPAVGSANSAPEYPGAPSEKPAAEKPKEGDAPQVTWGPLPVPVYPNSQATGQTQRVTGDEKPVAYRNFYYTTTDSLAQVQAFYRDRLGADIDVRNLGQDVAIFKNLDKGQVLISLRPVAGGGTSICIQESQQLPPKKHGLFGR